MIEYFCPYTLFNLFISFILKVNYNEFIPIFEFQNPDFKWDDVQAKIFKMIRQIFEGKFKETLIWKKNNYFNFFLNKKELVWKNHRKAFAIIINHEQCMQ